MEPNGVGGLDFISAPITVTFSYDQRRKEVVIPILNDTIIEGREDFMVTLPANDIDYTDYAYYDYGDNTTVYITDNTGKN